MRNAPEPLPPIDGTLFLHGGGSVDSEMRQQFIELAGGEKAKLVVIPTADTNDPLNELKLEVWRREGRARSSRLHAASRDEANDSSLAACSTRQPVSGLAAGSKACSMKGTPEH